MFDDLMNQMKNMMESSKSKLEEMEIEVERDGIKVICNGNRVLKDISISEALLSGGDKEEIEDILLVAINEAFLKADGVSSEAMKGLADGIIPGGLDGLF